MSDGTKIEWTDATWNPIVGCSVVSPGCTNCYAMRLAGTRMKHHPSRAGLTRDSKAGPVWTGEVRFQEQWLTQPLRWSKPRMIFVCAHADLFHENVPDEWIDRVFRVMSTVPRHTFQILTKRPERMRNYMSDPTLHARVRFEARPPWPLPNVWLGVSVEDQRRADERIPILLDTPAAIRWVSAEPLLGPIDLRNLRQFNPSGRPWVNAMNGLVTHGDYLARSSSECSINTRTRIPGELPRLDWVVAGGESGPGARPANPQWFRDLRDQCAAAGVPYLHKQNGEWVSVSEVAGDGPHHSFADGRTVRRVGKKAAGRLLDGVIHDGYPEAFR